MIPHRLPLGALAAKFGDDEGTCVRSTRSSLCMNLLQTQGWLVLVSNGHSKSLSGRRPSGITLQPAWCRQVDTPDRASRRSIHRADRRNVKTGAAVTPSPIKSPNDTWVPLRSLDHSSPTKQRGAFAACSAPHGAQERRKPNCQEQGQR